MDTALADHEIGAILARLKDISEDQRTEPNISSGVAMEVVNDVNENRRVTISAELLTSLVQTVEQVLWKREQAARDHGLVVPECVARRRTMVDQARTLLKNNAHGNDWCYHRLQATIQGVHGL